MPLPTAPSEHAALGCTLPAREANGDWPYGAIATAAHYCGLAPTVPAPPGEWQHGWHPAYHNIHPELVVGYDGRSRERRKTDRFWVARTDQADYLRAHGYLHVEAIGLPLVYARPLPVPRLAGSLLVMPVHSLANTTHVWGFEQYADAIAAVRERFSTVVACVHPTCFERGYWVDAFRSRNIPVVSGASLHDGASLPRIATLFSRFEFLTSNGFGSHLAYGAFFGAKPSLYGPLAAYSAEDYQRENFYRRCPELIAPVIEFVSEAALRTRHAELFRLPWTAADAKGWAERELGFDRRCSPAVLRHHFEWTFSRLARYTAVGWKNRVQAKLRRTLA